MLKLGLIVILSTFSSLVFGEWKSVYTDSEKDCVVVSSATEQAPIDFFRSECKSFGGFQLAISGGDLRYGPELKFGQNEIDLGSPGGFHDMASEHLEWIYNIEVDKEGLGAIEWKGIIYQLSVADEDGKDSLIFYSIRLNGDKSCLIGTSNINEEARDLIYNSKSICKEQEL